MAALLVGCEQPAWLTDRDPLPALPTWSEPLMGRPIGQAFRLAPERACIGNVEQVEHRYEGAPRPGVRITGWAWDAGGKVAPARILVVGPDGRIAGAGATGRARPDVNEARADITSPTTGWAALAPLRKGRVTVYGVLSDGARVCKLGRLKL